MRIEKKNEMQQQTKKKKIGKNFSALSKKKM